MFAFSLEQKIVRVLLLMAVGWLGVACTFIAAPTPRYRTPTPTVVTTRVANPTPPAPSILWWADMETGDLSQWYLPDVVGGANTGGGIYNIGSGHANLTDLIAHRGRYSTELTVDKAEGTSQAARLFRWRENPAEAYYTVWYMFPQTYTIANYWNVLQFQDPKGALWVLNVGNRPDSGEMYFYLYDGEQKKTYVQSFYQIPVGRWVQIMVYYRRATDNTGRITVWQDGILLFDLDKIQTSTSDQLQVSVNNYTDNISPSPASIYVDDISISTQRLEQ